MNTEKKFFHSNTAIVTLFAACFVVLISLGVRQVFGLFFIDFNESLNISNTAFGLAIGIQMLMWGITGPIFGAVADRYGGHIAIISAFIFYTLGIYFLYTGPNTGIFFSKIHEAKFKKMDAQRKTKCIFQTFTVKESFWVKRESCTGNPPDSWFRNLRFWQIGDF